MDFPKIDNFTIKSIKDQKICYTSYDAIDESTKKPVILKVLDQDLMIDEKSQLQIKNNIEIVKNLYSKNICKVLGYGSDPNNEYHYVVNEANDLKPLSALILDEFSLSPEDLLNIFDALGMTLRHAHLHGILHGLLNPNSIYISSEGDIKIDDFGFNWCVPYLFKKNKKQNLFIAQYIAPDYYEAVERADGRSDIYSLGIILHEIIAGKPAFSGTTITSIKAQHLSEAISTAKVQQAGLPVGIGSLISRATSKNVNNRFQNFKQFLSSIDSIKEEYLAEPESKNIESKPEARPLSLKTSNLINKRFIFSGAGAIFLVILILFVTNYIPSHFRNPGKSTTESNPEPISSSKEDIVQTDSVLYTAKNLTPEPNQENEIQTAKEAELEHNGSEEKSIIQKQTQNHAKDNNGIPAITKPVVSKPPAMVSSVTFLVESGQKPVQANIFIDNNYIGKTDNSGKIEIHDLAINETYKVKVSREGYSSYTDEIKVKESNSTRKVSITPIKQNVSTGTLILDAIPVADEIYIDGILHQGKTPMRIAIEQGKHTVKLVNNSVNADYEQTVDLKVKQIVRIKHDFTKLQSGQVAVILENAAQFGFGYVYVDDNLWHERNNTTPLQITLPTGSHKIALRRPGFKATPEEITVTVERDKVVTAAFKFVQVE